MCVYIYMCVCVHTFLCYIHTTYNILQYVCLFVLLDQSPFASRSLGHNGGNEGTSLRST